MDRRRFIRNVKLITTIATCLLVVLVGVIIGQYVKLGRLNKQNQALASELASKQAYRQQLSEGITSRKSSAYLELQAREQLGLLKDGETLYIYN